MAARAARLRERLRGDQRVDISHLLRRASDTGASVETLLAHRARSRNSCVDALVGVMVGRRIYYSGSKMAYG